MSSILQSIRNTVTDTITRITSQVANSHINDSDTPTSLQLSPTDVIDLSCLDDYIPSDVQSIILDYISVLDYTVHSNTQPLIATNNADISHLTITVPNTAAAIDNIEVYTYSHDQGFCQPGSACYSWFDIALQSIHPSVIHTDDIDDTDTQVQQQDSIVTNHRERCIDNIVANRNYHHYTKQYNNTTQLVKQYNTDLQQQLVIYVRTMFPAWANFVEQVSVKVGYIRSYTQPNTTTEQTTEQNTTPDIIQHTDIPPVQSVVQRVNNTTVRLMPVHFHHA